MDTLYTYMYLQSHTHWYTHIFIIIHLLASPSLSFTLIPQHTICWTVSTTLPNHTIHRPSLPHHKLQIFWSPKDGRQSVVCQGWVPWCDWVLHISTGGLSSDSHGEKGHLLQVRGTEGREGLKRGRREGKEKEWEGGGGKEKRRKEVWEGKERSCVLTDKWQLPTYVLWIEGPLYGLNF